MRIGFLSHGPLAAWVRFSSDTSPTSADLLSTVGIGIKLFGVPGRNALGEDSATADLIMQNFPVFFVDDAKEMCAFTYAGVVAGDYPGYLAHHSRTKKILDDMAKVEGSMLTSTYWAILPFRLGAQIVKYRLEPETPPENVANNAADYLATDMANRLAAREYRFRLSGTASDRARGDAARSGDRRVARAAERFRSCCNFDPAAAGRAGARPVGVRPGAFLQHLARAGGERAGA